MKEYENELRITLFKDIKTNESIKIKRCKTFCIGSINTKLKLVMTYRYIIKL